MNQQRVIRGVDWGDYEIFHPGVDRPLNEVSKQEARQHYKLVMESVPERLTQLRELLERNGVDIEDLASVDQWFFGSVQDNGEGTGRLAGIWYSISNDIGIMLVERLIAETNGALRWELVEGATRNVSFQRPVIRGFNVENKKYSYDYDLLVGAYGHRIVGGGRAEGLLEMLYAKSLAKAPRPTDNSQPFLPAASVSRTWPGDTAKTREAASGWIG